MRAASGGPCGPSNLTVECGRRGTLLVVAPVLRACPQADWLVAYEAGAQLPIALGRPQRCCSVRVERLWTCWKGIVLSRACLAWARQARCGPTMAAGAFF